MKYHVLMAPRLHRTVDSASATHATQVAAVTAYALHMAMRMLMKTSVSVTKVTGAASVNFEAALEESMTAPCMGPVTVPRRTAYVYQVHI